MVRRRCTRRRRLELVGPVEGERPAGSGQGEAGRLDAENITADYAVGVPTLTILVREAAKPPRHSGNQQGPEEP